ncbi:hypothetical protein AST00_01830 [Staphylococcus equorum]|uniref:hypothetical protein n=1 Tax=Staphylococcus equorum TaxID=246432 RepID=UPI000853EB1B|nr:hypothetical protein [Staphylococcus equorum]OEK71022.1 hypothetical protein AST00_01830 [Staphylococcus equorum]
MYLNKLIGLLDNEKIESLELTLVTGEEIIVDEIAKENKEANFLIVNNPEISIINLNHVVKVVPKEAINIDENFDLLEQLNF